MQDLRQAQMPTLMGSPQYSHQQLYPRRKSSVTEFSRQPSPPAGCVLERPSALAAVERSASPLVVSERQCSPFVQREFQQARANAQVPQRGEGIALAAPVAAGGFGLYSYPPEVHDIPVNQDRVVTYDCPACDAKFLYPQEVSAHWSAEHSSTLPSSVSHAPPLASSFPQLDKGEKVHVFSASRQEWIPDGIVIEVLDEDLHVEGGFALAAGSVKVAFNGGLASKWIPLDKLGTLLKRHRTLVAAHEPSSGSGSQGSGSDGFGALANVRIEEEYLCPSCSERFSSEEEACAHWVASHAPRQDATLSQQEMSQPLAASADPPVGENPASSVLNYQCSACSAMFLTKDEASEHLMSCPEVRASRGEEYGSVATTLPPQSSSLHDLMVEPHDDPLIKSASSQATVQPEDLPSAEEPVAATATYVCSTCQACFASSEAVCAHWVEVHSSQATKPVAQDSDSFVGEKISGSYNVGSQSSPIASVDCGYHEGAEGTSSQCVQQLGFEVGEQSTLEEPILSASVSYGCAHCDMKFETKETWWAHWSQAHNSAHEEPGVQSASTIVDLPAPDSESLVEEEAAYVPEHQEKACAEQENSPAACTYGCPQCDQVFPTMEEACAHHLDVHAPPSKGQATFVDGVCMSSGAVSSDTHSDDVPVRSASSKLAAALGPVQCVERDHDGEPTIVRQEDPVTGQLRTIVFNVDGSHRAFGEKTVSSMADSDEADIHKWISGMTDLHLKGLVHEVTDRACKGSSTYHRKKDELEKLYQQRNYTYFGLSADADEVDLDKVYRRLARSMHPDKNGGTDKAKEAFQNMKERYEMLKQQLANKRKQESKVKQQDDGQPSRQEEEEHQQEHKEQGELRCVEDGEAPCDAPPRQEKHHRREAYDEDDCDEREGQSKDPSVAVINPNTQDRAELEKIAWQMLQQLRQIRVEMVKMDTEFSKFTPEES